MNTQSLAVSTFRLALMWGYSCLATAAPAYFPDGNALGPGVVSIVDTATWSIRSEQFSTPIMPAAAVASLDGRRLYVISLYERIGVGFPGILTVFTTADRKTLKSFSTASGRQLVAVSPNSSRIYVNGPDEKSLLVIDAEQLEVIASIPISAPFTSLAFSPDGSTAYATTTSQLYVVDLRTYAVAGPITLLTTPLAIVTSPDGTLAYVAHKSTPGAVSVIDTTTRAVVAVIATAADAVSLAVTPDGQRLYVAHSSGGLVSVVDTVSRTVSQVVQTNLAPSAVDLTADGKFAYVASRGDKSVAVLNTQTNQVVETIAGFPGFGPTTPGNFMGPEPSAAVEFYNPSLDHYFITSDSSEIGDLDKGVHKGWVRTRQTFLTYPSGTSAGRGQATCRFYGLPSAGLDSHFYSASKAECDAVSAKFPGSWSKESDNVFEIGLPDVGGICGVGSYPVYRLWNGRADSNHRYTMHAATRQQMIAKGYVAEGYSPDGIAMCAPDKL